LKSYCTITGRTRAVSEGIKLPFLSLIKLLPITSAEVTSKLLRIDKVLEGAITQSKEWLSRARCLLFGDGF
jgi:hypothetical protein